MVAGGRIDVAAYYARLLAFPIEEGARILLAGRIMVETPTRLECDCPRHASTSKRSLHIDRHRGLWYCFACGKGGDVLQLVEFVLHGVVTKGAGGKLTDTHRAARDWLAEKVGLPPLGRATGGDGEAAETRHLAGDAVFDVLADLVDIHHARLLAQPDVLKWILEKYGFDEEVVREFRIGLGGIDDVSQLAAKGHDERAIVSTGAFMVDSRDVPRPLFPGRVMFPYFSRAKPRFDIGRRCPATPDTRFEQAKYKKLLVHVEATHPWVSRAIDNGLLWGEDVLLGRPSRVVMTEGVTDAIAAQRAGFPTISPVTARLKREDLERLVRRLRGFGGEVVLVQDNEVSGIGLDAALATARALEREGVRVRVAVLPLRHAQEAARAELAALLGDEAMAAVRRARPAERGGLIEKAAAGDAAKATRAASLIEAGKLDVCEWFRTGGTPEEFEAILGAARPAIEVALDMAPVVEDPVEQVNVLADVLAAAADLAPAAREQFLKRVKDKTGLPLATLRGEVGAAKRAEKAKPGPSPTARRIPQADPGTCRALIEQAIIDARANKEVPDWGRIAEAVYDWISSHEGVFFRDRTGLPSLFFEDEVWRMASPDPGARHRYQGLLYRITGHVPTTTPGRTLYATLAALASDRGTVRDEFGWVATREQEHVVYVTLSNAEHQIVRISPDGVEAVQNGSNADGVILRAESGLDSISWIEDADPDRLDELLDERIGRYLACSAGERRVLLDWICCFPLVEFAGLRPTARLEGPPGSGKTWAAKLLTTLVMGSDRQKKSTEAANYADAARSPLLALDNIETENAVRPLIDFLLNATCGTPRQKVGINSDANLLEQRPKCLIMSTGVEPLGGELQEMMSRTLCFLFDVGQQASSVMMEADVLSKLRAARSEILCCLFKRLGRVMALMRDGALARAANVLRRSLGEDRSGRRTDDFFGLMYLLRVSGARAEDRDAMLARVDEEYLDALRRLISTVAAISREASPIATGLLGLFTAMRTDRAWSLKTGLHLIDGESLGFANNSAQEIHNALQMLRRDRGLEHHFKNPVQLGRRLVSAIPMLAEHGIRVEVARGRNNTSVYTVTSEPRTRAPLGGIGGIAGSAGDDQDAGRAAPPNANGW